MKHNIKEIVERFDKRFYPLDKTDILKDDFKNGRFWGRKECLQEAKDFLIQSHIDTLDDLIESTNTIDFYDWNIETQRMIKEKIKTLLQKIKEELKELIK